jgi:hypothetical protein
VVEAVRNTLIYFRENRDRLFEQPAAARAPPDKEAS